MIDNSMHIFSVAIVFAVLFCSSLHAAETVLSDAAFAACEAGELQVCADISNAYRFGQRDEDKVFEYAKKACKGQATFTCYPLAMAYRKGQGTDEDFEKAFDLLSNICQAKAGTKIDVNVKERSCESAAKLARIFPDLQVASSEESASKNAGKKPEESEIKKSISSINTRILPDLSKTTGVVNFFFSNSCSSSSPINVIFRETYEGEVTGYKWPSEGYYSLENKGETRTMSIRCAYPSSVCYGATVDLSSKSHSWGLGLNHDRGCSNCCYACPLRSTGYGYRDVKKDFVCK